MENLSQPKYIINPDYQLNIGNAFSDGLALFKKDTGTILINYLLTIIMGMIPLCSLLGLGNFYKACRKIENGEKTDSGDIFNFDDVIPYLIFAGIMIFGVLALLIPVEVVILVSAVLTEKNQGQAHVFVLIMIIAVLIIFAIAMVVSSVMYYYVAVVALFGVKDFSNAFKISWKLFKKNALSSILFSIMISMITSVGILLCGVGILLTLPLAICMRYAATKNIMIRFEEPKIDYESSL
ncbi:hypothetical protein HZP95_04240 [Elizabethkingia anophelis]|nr:hypothetical protein [Elizabethkingia anophelis]MCT4100522.1 hypothetical protein [Elizabethkingia anophelis]MCT4165189.1 hypothetical protein [Elizabethkingia anophelis]MDV3591163.1 hypothetical protein [Elizabethkingia anophelis]HAY3537946.1 hypothetical protein [Elizabethkingia anophelis]